MIRAFFAALAFLLLTSCGTVSVSDYAADQPPLDLKAYFNGKVDGWGTIQDRSGKVTKRMYVEMTCTWVGDTGTLDERFSYADGTKETRIWTIRKNGNRYIGTAGDVVGEAVGEAAGNALRWRYVLALEVDGRTWHLDFDDWMYLQDERVMLNRSVMSKWGIRLGEVFIAFRRRG